MGAPTPPAAVAVVGFVDAVMAATATVVVVDAAAAAAAATGAVDDSAAMPVVPCTAAFGRGACAADELPLWRLTRPEATSGDVDIGAVTDRERSERKVQCGQIEVERPAAAAAARTRSRAEVRRCRRARILASCGKHQGR